MALETHRRPTFLCKAKSESRKKPGGPSTRLRGPHSSWVRYADWTTTLRIQVMAARLGPLQVTMIHTVHTVSVMHNKLYYYSYNTQDSIIPSTVIYFEYSTLSQSLWVICWLNMFTWIKRHCVHCHVSWNIMSSSFDICVCIMLLMWAKAVKAPNPSKFDIQTTLIVCSVLTSHEAVLGVHLGPFYFMRLNCISIFYQGQGWNSAEHSVALGSRLMTI